MHFVVASALRTRHARLFIAQAFRTWHRHFPSLFVCQRRLRGINTSVCQHRLLERGIHAFPLTFYRPYMRFRSCEHDPAAKIKHASVESSRVVKAIHESYGLIDSSGTAVAIVCCARVLSNEMHFSGRQIVSSGRFSY